MTDDMIAALRDALDAEAHQLKDESRRQLMDAHRRYLAADDDPFLALGAAMMSSLAAGATEAADEIRRLGDSIANLDRRCRDPFCHVPFHVHHVTRAQGWFLQ